MPIGVTATRLYRGLLVLYPAEFRDHFAREMSLVLADRIREQDSVAGVWAVWLDAVAALALHAPKEHYFMLKQEIVYALRMMRRDRLVTLIAILVLALGIGSTTAVFSLVNGILLRPQPYPDPQRLVYVEESLRGLYSSVSYPNYLDLRAHSQLLDELAIFSNDFDTISGDGDAERVPALSATAGLGKVLGVAPLLGRWFDAAEDQPRAAPVALISEGLWRRRFGGDPDIVGKTFTLDYASTRIIGVMAAGFHFPDTAEIWTPFHLDPKSAPRTDHFAQGVARLRPGVSIAQAQAELRAIMAQILKDHPAESQGQTVALAVWPGQETKPLRPVLLTLLAAVGFVLLIACANITNLLLVKASARGREIAVRAALGASRFRLIRQLVVESLLLGALGAAAGLLLARLAIPALLALVPVDRPAWMNFSLDSRILLFTLAVTIFTGLLVGIIPALTASRSRPIESLKEGGRSGSAGRGRVWFRNAMVMGQIALSLILLVGAGLMMRSFLRLQRQDLGFATDTVTTMQIVAPTARYPRGPQGVEITRRLLAEIASVPGVVSVAAGSSVPLAPNWGRTMTVEGYPVLSLQDAPMVNHVAITPGYFRSLGIPLLEGRDFTDTDAKDPGVVIVDAALAKHYWLNGSALGKRIRFGPPLDNEPWHTIVGVVASVRNESAKKGLHSTTYLPSGEYGWSTWTYAIRTKDSTANPIGMARSRIAAIDRDIAVSRVRTIRQILDQTIWQERFFTIVLAFFAGLALALAAIGLYGVMSYTVAQRTHELGIRIALGASSGDLKRMVLSQSAALLFAGLAAGGAGALALTRWLLADRLFQISPMDPATFVGVAIVLSLATLIASYIPARRATRIDPIVALRND